MKQVYLEVKGIDIDSDSKDYFISRLSEHFTKFKLIDFESGITKMGGLVYFKAILDETATN